MCCIGTFDSIMEKQKKQAKFVIWELIYELCIVMNFTKKMSSFMNSLASIVFNDSHGV